jgi:nucleoredoxin
MGCSSTKSINYESAAPGRAVPAEPLSPEAKAKFAELFGEKLQSKAGEISVEEALAGKEAIGIYFSAHWCPPCRGFTPALAKSYKSSLQSKGMEIVFVSSDRSEKDFQSYYKEMPWLAVPYSRRDIHQALNKKFKVQGIPSLVILDRSGQVITTDGRSKISSDPKGQDFPWKPKPFAEVIGSSFRKGDAVVGKEAIAGKILGIYFSAHWCPPCRGFTPTLSKHYKAYKEKGLPFEIVFCTGDKDETSFESYYKEMVADGGDWLAMPWSSSAQRTELNSLFEVSGIPCLVIVDENGCVINKNARGAVASDPTGESFPWTPPAVGDLASPEGINETPSVCVFLEGVVMEQQKEILLEMEQVAKKCIEAAKETGEEPAYRFFVARSDEGAVPQLRKLCSLPKDAQDQPVMLLLDLDDNGAFYSSDESDISVATIGDLTKAYEDKTLARKQMSK